MVFTLFFYFQFHSWKEALLHGIFQASSAFTNAGFDLFGTSLIHFSDNYMLQLIYLWLMITGAIGFPVLIEVKEWLSSPNRRLFRFSPLPKLLLLHILSCCSVDSSSSGYLKEVTPMQKKA